MVWISSYFSGKAEKSLLFRNGRQKNIPEMQANAALIAAAPKLYKMLKLACYEIEIMANYCEENNMERDAQSYTNLVFYIHKVLKKARGEE
jgi:hypothetical protein